MRWGISAFRFGLSVEVFAFSFCFAWGHPPFRFDFFVLTSCTFVHVVSTLASTCACARRRIGMHGFGWLFASSGGCSRILSVLFSHFFNFRQQHQDSKHQHRQQQGQRFWVVHGTFLGVASCAPGIDTQQQTSAHTETITMTMTAKTTITTMTMTEILGGARADPVHQRTFLGVASCAPGIDTQQQTSAHTETITMTMAAKTTITTMTMTEISNISDGHGSMHNLMVPKGQRPALGSDQRSLARGLVSGQQ